VLRQAFHQALSVPDAPTAPDAAETPDGSIGLPAGAEFPAPEVPPRPESLPSLTRRLGHPRTILSLLVAAALLGFSLRQLGTETLGETARLLRGANLPLYVLALLVYYATFAVRSLRWRLLLRNAGVDEAHIPPLRDLAEIIYLSWFANALTPAKLGDVYRGWLLRRESGASWTRSMGTIVAERLLDVIVLVTLMIGMGWLAYRSLLRGEPVMHLTCTDNPAVHNIGRLFVQLFTIGGAGVAALLIGLAIFARFGAHLERFLPHRLAHIYVNFSGALVLSFKRFGPLLGLSITAWVIEAARFYLIGQSVGYALPIPLAVFVALLSAFMTTIPVTPGGVGFEGLLAGALCLKGLPAAGAWALILADRSLSYLSIVLGGGLVYALSRKTK
jgi:uncharacterized membrane protein YbhN (UPF0104 family)